MQALAKVLGCNNIGTQWMSSALQASETQPLRQLPQPGQRVPAAQPTGSSATPTAVLASPPPLAQSRLQSHDPTAGQLSPESQAFIEDLSIDEVKIAARSYKVVILRPCMAF